MADRGSKRDRTTAAEARAEAEAASRANRAGQRAALEDHFAAGVPGGVLIRTNHAITAVFAVLTTIAVVVNSKPTRHLAAWFDVIVFVVGCVLFVVALYLGAQRSRESEMTMAGWWFLTGSAPRPVQWALLGSTVAQVVVAIAGAAFRPFSALAFGTLVPMFGLAICGIWGAQHGMFPPRRTGTRL